MRATVLVSLVVGVVGLAGCGGEDATAGAGGGAATGKTIRVRGKVLDTVTAAGLEGADVCVIRPDEGCVKTGADGSYTFDGVPADTDIVASAALGDDYFTTVAVAHTKDVEMEATFDVARRAFANILASSVGVTPDPQKGHVSFLGAGSKTTGGVDGGKPLKGVPGLTATLEPSGPKPIYGTEAMTLDPKLEATTALGAGFFFNVAPADSMTVKATPPAGITCTYEFAAPGAAPNELTAPVFADAITLVALTCE